MKTTRALSFAAVMTTILLPQIALANAELAKKSLCMSCHAVERKLVGPAYAEIAKKYAADKEAVAKLTESIKKGGSGKWGAIPMPAQPNLKEDEAKALATWILAGAK